VKLSNLIAKHFANYGVVYCKAFCSIKFKMPYLDEFKILKGKRL